MFFGQRQLWLGVLAPWLLLLLGANSRGSEIGNSYRSNAIHMIRWSDYSNAQRVNKGTLWVAT